MNKESISNSFKYNKNLELINWYTWSKDTFEEAINQDKPIFLSIGYS